jgi:hypothetical protein
MPKAVPVISRLRGANVTSWVPMVIKVWRQDDLLGVIDHERAGEARHGRGNPVVDEGGDAKGQGPHVVGHGELKTLL